MEYVKHNLLLNEKILLLQKPHWVIFLSSPGPLIIAIYILFYAPPSLNFYFYQQYTVYHLVGLLLIATAIYWFLQALITYYTSEYAITDKRVMMKVGWIRRHSIEIMIEKVEGILVDQSILGRIFSYGTITIIGTGGTKDSFMYIPNPLVFRKTVQEQIDVIEQKLMSH